MKDLQHIIGKIDYLPPFPSVVARALSMLDSPKVKPEQIVEVIKFDPGIATNILRLCNSSYFGLNRSITSLQEALIYIGLARFREILVLSGTRQFFEKKSPGYEMRKGELWRFALASSVTAKELSKIIPVDNSESVFLAALLHDLGKLVLSEFITDSWNMIHEKVEHQGLTFIDAEKEVVGIDHAELGAMILETWGFPPAVINAVRKHHRPLEDDDTVLDDIVKISVTLTMMMGYGTSVDGLAYHGFDEVCRRNNLHTDMLDRVMGESLEIINEVESDYGICILEDS
ncbi:HDOD domain-containing protein [bacterium]|nr:HDOD domain-containing protein [bacterium]